MKNNVKKEENIGNRIQGLAIALFCINMVGIVILAFYLTSISALYLLIIIPVLVFHILALNIIEGFIDLINTSRKIKESIENTQTNLKTTNNLLSEIISNSEHSQNNGNSNSVT